MGPFSQPIDSTPSQILTLRLLFLQPIGYIQTLLPSPQTPFPGPDPTPETLTPLLQRVPSPQISLEPFQFADSCRFLIFWYVAFPEPTPILIQTLPSKSDPHPKPLSFQTALQDSQTALSLLLPEGPVFSSFPHETPWLIPVQELTESGAHDALPALSLTCGAGLCWGSKSPGGPFTSPGCGWGPRLGPCPAS